MTWNKSIPLGLLMLMAYNGSALASGSIKVECVGNCNNVNLGQVCDTYSINSRPIAIACDDTADPGAGGRVGCGTGSTACTPFGEIIRSDLVGAYCRDAGGNDVVVTCTTSSTPLAAAPNSAIQKRGQ